MFGFTTACKISNFVRLYDQDSVVSVNYCLIFLGHKPNCYTNEIKVKINYGP